VDRDPRSIPCVDEQQSPLRDVAGVGAKPLERRPEHGNPSQTPRFEPDGGLVASFRSSPTRLSAQTVTDERQWSYLNSTDHSPDSGARMEIARRRGTTDACRGPSPTRSFGSCARCSRSARCWTVSVAKTIGLRPSGGPVPMYTQRPEGACSSRLLNQFRRNQVAWCLGMSNFRRRTECLRRLSFPMAAKRYAHQ
jgi:hypothetical protein